MLHAAPSFLSGGGAVGALLRDSGGSASALGPPERWPLALRSAVALMLNSRVAMFLAWGPDLRLVYNDAYAEILGAKHPAALGAPFRVVWAELWTEVAPLVAAAMAGDAIYREDLPLRMNRHGYDEHAWFTFSYSPIRGDTGSIDGMFCAVAETTTQVRARRRQAFRLTLEERLRELSDPATIMATAAEVLGRELDVARVGYGEVDPAERVLVVEADWTDGRLPSLIGKHRTENFGRDVMAALKTGRTLAIPDVLADPRVGNGAAAFTAISTRSTLAVPLIKGGHFTALLYLHDPQPRHWDETDQRLTREVAERTWAVVERARAEMRLRDREELLRLALDAAEIGLWNVDMVTNTLLWPPRVRAMFGFTSDAPVSPEDFMACLHPDDRERVAAAFFASTDPLLRPPYDVEYRIIGPHDRRQRWVAAKGRAVFDESGRCLRMIGTAIDVTRRKADEERLRELNETLERRFAETLAERKLLADIVERTDVFVQVCDLDYTWLAINRASADEFAKVFKVPRPKAGDNMLKALEGQPENLEVVRRLWGRALAGEEFLDIGTIGTGRDARHYEMRFQALRDESGNVVGAYQFMNEVTARLREQARLRDAEAALTQAQKMEAVGQLTGGIAHDFNNLLSAIVGNFELIKARPEEKEWVLRFAQSGLQVAERGAKLTGQLLAFSRSQRIELRALDVAELIGGMRDMLARTLGPMIRLQFELETGDRAVLSDATQLEMAVLNLAINARDAMPGGGTLTLRSALRELADEAGLPSGTYIEISVTDTGVGMTADVLSHAFDPFFTTKGVGQGTGLGLSQVYAIARQGGGTARIDSEPGRGTTVSLLLPATDRDGPRESAASAAPEPVPMRERAKVLLVDDDRDIRDVIHALLEGLGYEVRAAEDGASCLSQLESFEPQLLLVDFAMPGMSGAELARAVRARRPAMPIVFASGYADTAAIEDVPGSPCPMLRKPFVVGELRRVLAEALRPAE